MRPFGVAPDLELAIDMVQLPLTDDHELVEAPDLERLDEPLDMRSKARRGRRVPHDR